MVAHITPFLRLRGHRVKRQLHSGVDLDGSEIGVQLELVDIGPKTAVVDVRRPGLRIDEQVGVDGVCGVERVDGGRAGGEDLAVVGPATWQ